MCPVHRLSNPTLALQAAGSKMGFGAQGGGGGLNTRFIGCHIMTHFTWLYMHCSMHLWLTSFLDSNVLSLAANPLLGSVTRFSGSRCACTTAPPIFHLTGSEHKVSCTLCAPCTLCSGAHACLGDHSLGGGQVWQARSIEGIILLKCRNSETCNNKGKTPFHDHLEYLPIQNPLSGRGGAH